MSGGGLKAPPLIFVFQQILGRISPQGISTSRSPPMEVLMETIPFGSAAETRPRRPRLRREATV